MAVEYTCCTPSFFLHILIIVFLVLFAGLMSGLTLGLMSLSLVDLEVLEKSGTPKDKKHAAKILPVVRNQHLLLCTLLICNAGAMEALPIFLDGLVSAWGAILISVTLILLFGEIIPQSVCTRYGLAIGGNVTLFVRLLVLICFPIAYPISKLLDYMLGHENKALFRRAELKTLVNLHGNEAGKGGELTHDETTIIAGALELVEKTAGDAMTPISETFAIDINAKLDRSLMNIILEKGHSRIPVYYEQPTNIIGLVLAKNLLTVHVEDEVPVKNVTIRRIPRVPETMPLYEILHEFQKGHSHMAVVVKQSTKALDQPATSIPEDRCDQKHEEEMDHEAIYKDFVLRVMAARSPNVRLRKTLGKSSRTPLKCPLSAPPKTSKPRFAVISSISKVDGERNKVIKSPSEPGLTPKAKVKQVASKYLTTPRNKTKLSNPKGFRSVQNAKPANVELQKSRMVAKALVFPSPKKTVRMKTSIEQRTPLTKLYERMSRLKITDQRMQHVLGYSSKASSDSGIDASRKKLKSLYSQTCDTITAKPVISQRSKSKGKLPNKQVSKKLLLNDHIDSSKLKYGSDFNKKMPVIKVAKDLEIQECMQEDGHVSSVMPLLLYNSDSASADETNGEGGKCVQLGDCDSVSFQATNREGNDINDGYELNDALRTNSDDHVETFGQIIETDSSERGGNEHELMDGGDDKENAAGSDENRRHDDNMNQNGRKIFGMHDKCGVIEKVAQARDKNLKEGLISSGALAPGMKFRKPKPTNPKPFRLRTDERGILKEATLERKATSLASQSESSNLSTFGGKLQMKQGRDNQRGRSTGTVKQQNHSSSAHQDPKQMSSSLESKATQRLEKFRKIASPIRPQGLASTKKEILTSVLIPGQKLEVIHETPLRRSKLERARKETRTGVSPATGGSSFPPQRRTVVEPNFHGTKVPRSCCTRKL